MIYPIAPSVKSSTRLGFTLIEISIVLVIIGLIIGGILTGRDLINAATQRAQIAQMEKYSTAVRTFQNKYGYLPGDIPEPYATKFGFQPRGTVPGEGDGNGIIESNCNNSSAGTDGYARNGCAGEVAVFWEDLSSANLIDATMLGADKIAGQYPNTTANGASGGLSLATTPGVKDWLPAAKIGNNTFVYVYGMGGANYFAVSTVTTLNWDIYSTSNPGLTVQQAYNIDKKIDDGFPQSGSVTPCYINYLVTGSGGYIYAAGSLQQGMAGYSPVTGFCTPNPTAAGPASTDCFDNNGVAGTQTYALKNATLQNCALSFKFQ